MIHYHGIPITPETACAQIIAGRHAMVSFAHPGQIEIVALACQSFTLDNGAFSAWRSGSPVADWKPYYAWVNEWSKHPGFDWALIPDIIDGSEKDNDVQIAIWPLGYRGVPIWHMHESLQKLRRLCENWPRVAFGSSGEYAQIGTPAWEGRMREAMDMACPFGWPLARLHGLRMLDPKVFSRFPFSSADSTNVGRNIGMDCAWDGPYAPKDRGGRGMLMAMNIEATNSAAKWIPGATQEPLFPLAVE